MAMVNMTHVESLQDATGLLNQPVELRRQATEEGYLFFPNLLDSAKVLNLRQQIMAICEKHGWTQAGTDCMEGLANPELLVVEGGD